jgi:hypothetical protein
MDERGRLEQELEKVAKKWIDDEMVVRMESVGVDEVEVRKQVEHEADRWLKWNLDQRSRGNEGTASPSDGIGHLAQSNPNTPEW